MKKKFCDLLVNFTNRKNQNSATKNLLWRQYPGVRNSLLAQLLKDKTINSNYTYELLDFLDIKFSHKYFCVAVVNVDNLKQQNNSKMAVPNIINDVLKNDIAFYIIHLDLGKVAILMNIARGNSEESSKFIYEAAEKIQTRINNRLLNSVNIGIGNIYKGIIGINKSYQEAIYCTDYKLSESNSIVVFERFNFKCKDYYYYPLSVEKKLINCIKIGNHKDASDLLIDIFEKNFKDHCFPIKICRCLFFDIMSTVLKIFSEINIDYSGDLCDKLFEKFGITECKTINEMYDVISDMIFNICTYINNNKKSHNTVLLGRIYRYLNENYTDSNISIAAIAEYVDVTPNYLSQFFKEQTGESVMAYINKMRINKVKEILKYSRENLETVAKAVGYTNNSILIRTFKKHEGITPGQYRQTCMIANRPKIKANDA